MYYRKTRPAPTRATLVYFYSVKSGEVDEEISKLAEPVGCNTVRHILFGFACLYILIAVHSRYGWISFMLINRGLG